MSFILDALRKSEHERQRAAGPSLAHVPTAVAPAPTPRWAIVAIVALATTVLVMTVAWWRTLGSVQVVAAPSTVVERALELPAPPSAPVPAAVRPAVTPASVPVPQTPLAEAVRGGSSAPLTTAVPSEPQEPTSTRAGDAETALPTAGALIAQGVPVPPLRLELHAYAAEPSARFVFINGRKYLEGERLADGPELVAVSVQGAVLRFNGQRFLLLPD